MPFAATGRSKPHPTTAATSHSARTNHVSVATPACLLVSAASPSTSSSQARPAPSLRTPSAPLWPASITCLKSWPFHSVEQPCVGAAAMAADMSKEGTYNADYTAFGAFKPTAIGKERVLATFDENGLWLSKGFAVQETW